MPLELLALPAKPRLKILLHLATIRSNAGGEGAEIRAKRTGPRRILSCRGQVELRSPPDARTTGGLGL